MIFWSTCWFRYQLVVPLNCNDSCDGGDHDDCGDNNEKAKMTSRWTLRSGSGKKDGSTRQSLELCQSGGDPFAFASIGVFCLWLPPCLLRFLGRDGYVYQTAWCCCQLDPLGAPMIRWRFTINIPGLGTQFLLSVIGGGPTGWSSFLLLKTKSKEFLTKSKEFPQFYLHKFQKNSFQVTFLQSLPSSCCLLLGLPSSCECPQPSLPNKVTLITITIVIIVIIVTIVIFQAVVNLHNLHLPKRSPPKVKRRAVREMCCNFDHRNRFMFNYLRGCESQLVTFQRLSES